MTSPEGTLLVQQPRRAVRASLRMGEMAVAADGEELQTLLGSCLGLALHDPTKKVGGLAHIVLPRTGNSSDRPGKCVDSAIPKLIELMKDLARGQLTLNAKIAGGAAMFKNNHTATIGAQNVAVCEEILDGLGIPIVGRHCGGQQGRRMSLDSKSGKVKIEVVGQPQLLM